LQVVQRLRLGRLLARLRGRLLLVVGRLQRLLTDGLS
jgi:hypothetical protein